MSKQRLNNKEKKNDKFRYNKVKEWLKDKFQFVFMSVFVLFFIVAMFAILTTLIELFIDYSIDLSKNGVICFFNAFDWCKVYIVAFFGLYSAYFAMNTYQVHNKNQVYNNILKPRSEDYLARLNLIKEHNLKMYDYFYHCGKGIIEEIVEKEQYIQSKEELKAYFDKYIKKQIIFFEKCGYNNKDCNKKICTELCKKGDPTYNGEFPHSLESFKTIAYELFCISYKYKDFWNDVDDLYKENISELKKYRCSE
jgi:hypothetical protein